MLKKLHYVVLFILCLSYGLKAQTVVFSDDFDNGDGKWNTGWIDGANTTVTFSIDNTSKLHGANSYKADITNGGDVTYLIQRNADLPLSPGFKYTVSFDAVASQAASINVLFEIAGDPYTKRLNETANVTTTAQTFTYSMISTESVPTNQLKLHYGGPQNDGAIIWLDNVVVTTEADPTLVTLWGNTPRGTAWPILNTSSTAPGTGMMGADAAPSGWASIRGSFAPLTPTLTKAVVITGTFEFVGGGGNNAYTWLRYAIIGDSGAVLSHKDSSNASWTGPNGNSYEFTPRSGTGELANGGGGSGVVWTVKNSGAWNSTYSNGGGPLVTVQQAPYGAVASAGVYDWAISVMPLADGTNEIRFYFVKQHAAGVMPTYWFGGTAIDPTPTTKSFSGIGFSVNNDVDATCKQVNLTNVRATLGDPITVPEAPFGASYVTMWGTTPRGNAWPIENDENTLDGNATLGDGTAPPSGWSSVKGGFRESVTPSVDKAFVITGKLEFIGGDGAGSSYTWMRYALFNQEGTLTGQNTPDAAWSDDETGNGYLFMPISGAGDVSNTYKSWPQGNQGTNWPLIKSNNWNSSNSNTSDPADNGGPIIPPVLQAPYHAQVVPGVYDWAISVQPLAAGGNEVRWYLIQQHDAGSSNYYWWGGSFVDDRSIATSFNSIGFAFDKGMGVNQVNITDVKIDKGDPITVPEAPWQAYYLTQWGLFGNQSNWTMTPGELDGDVNISGTAPANNLAVIRGTFGVPLTPKVGKAVSLTGKIELVGGGFETWCALRYGIFNTDDPLQSTGYLFMPRGGKTDIVYWLNAQQNGTWGGIVNSPWYIGNDANDYVLGNQYQTPANTVTTAGTYDFGYSVEPMSDGSNEIKTYLMKEDQTYYWAATATDNHTSSFASQYNSVLFALGSTEGTTAMKLHDIKVDLGNPITIPPDPNATDVAENELIPTEYALNQNYPNPFNPTTTIEFALPKAGNVKLVVYDVLGREVSELVNSEMDAGYHKVTFNATNLASGIYFYSIKAGDFSNVKKLMLLK